MAIMTTKPKISGFVISVNMVESNNAVTIYLEISNNHFPNSSFTRQSYLINDGAKIENFQETSKQFPSFFPVPAMSKSVFIAAKRRGQVCLDYAEASERSDRVRSFF